LCARLELVRSHYAERRGALRRRLLESAPETAAGPSGAGRTQLGAEPLEWVARTLLETADPVHGGWGGQHKFPHPEAIDFALIRWSETGDEAMRKLVLRTLRCMQQGEIHDGRRRPSLRDAPDWSAPTRKVLGSNALTLRVSRGSSAGRGGFRETAEGISALDGATLLDSGPARSGQPRRRPGHARDHARRALARATDRTDDLRPVECDDGLVLKASACSHRDDAQALRRSTASSKRCSTSARRLSLLGRHLPPAC
jgi:hypothetical protein